MALAVQMQGMLDKGTVKNYAELARLNHVSKARISQVMLLNNLAPDIQEALLFLPRTESCRDPITEHALRPIAAQPDWGKE